MAKLDWEREIEALVAKNITRETHGGAVNRVRYTLTQQLQQLIDKARLSGAYSAEVWREVGDGWGLFYQVSSAGRVRSVARGRNTGRILKPALIGRGYPRVSLFSSTDGKKDMLVHRLVAQAFIPNPDNLPCINHKDGNKLNNCVNNLEWCTHAYNNIHAVENGLSNITGANSSSARFTHEDVEIVRALKGKETGRSVAKRYGVDPSTVYNVWKGFTYKPVDQLNAKEG